MNALGSTWLTFGLLAVSICVVWLRPIQIARRFALPPWIVVFCAAIASGLATGYLTWIAVLELVIFGMTTFLAGRAEISRPWRIACGVFSAILALALAMHRLPGFHNPILIANVEFSADGVPFTQYANFDKGAAGLILLAFLCNRVHTAAEWRQVIRRALPIAIVTTFVVSATALTFGYVKPDLKWSWFTPVFLVTNLLFTCVAEEAFFRGFLQDRLSKALSHTVIGGPIAILCSGVLFGIAHFAGGPVYLLLSSLAGLGYAYAYADVKRIEAPIMVHFAFNAVHFVCLTYPHTQ
jgi:membrane protease YdiL (CAAX protease family)